MKRITSNKNQCVLASFAMVMDTTMEILIERLGHDGKDVILEEAGLPNGYRSFHPEEFVDLLLKDGYSATMVTTNPSMMHGEFTFDHSRFMGYQRFFDAFKLGSGVIFGQSRRSGLGHAVAWDVTKQMILDPRGREYSWSEASHNDFSPLQFYLISELK